jgi:hypothetical protein
VEGRFPKEQAPDAIRESVPCRKRTLRSVAYPRSLPLMKGEGREDLQIAHAVSSDATLAKARFSIAAFAVAD